MNRNINFMLALISFFAMSCSNQKSSNEPVIEPVKEEIGVHVHEDGTVHNEQHQEITPNQEEFNISKDSIAKEEHNHDNHEGHNH
jgi:hypothetical protein